MKALLSYLSGLATGVGLSAWWLARYRALALHSQTVADNALRAMDQMGRDFLEASRREVRR